MQWCRRHGLPLRRSDKGCVAHRLMARPRAMRRRCTAHAPRGRSLQHHHAVALSIGRAGAANWRQLLQTRPPALTLAPSPPRTLRTFSWLRWKEWQYDERGRGAKFALLLPGPPCGDFGALHCPCGCAGVGRLEWQAHPEGPAFITNSCHIGFRFCEPCAHVRRAEFSYGATSCAQ